MRSLQLFLGAYLAGAGYAEHAGDSDEDGPTRARLGTSPGRPLTWKVVMRRRRIVPAVVAPR